MESYQPRVLRPDPSHRRAEVGILSRADVTNEEPSPRLPYSWNCAWCKRQYVGLDRREPAHVRGHGSYLFCTTHCLRAWQTEQIPPALRREARYAVVSPPRDGGAGSWASYRRRSARSSGGAAWGIRIAPPVRTVRRPVKRWFMRLTGWTTGWTLFLWWAVIGWPASLDAAVVTLTVLSGSSILGLVVYTAGSRTARCRRRNRPWQGSDGGSATW